MVQFKATLATVLFFSIVVGMFYIPAHIWRYVCVTLLGIFCLWACLSAVGFVWKTFVEIFTPSEPLDPEF